MILDPKHRTMDDSDGKSCLKGAIRKGKQYMISHVDADDIEATKEAAKACPVYVIEVAG